MGLIAVEGMQFYAHHGYYKEEQIIGGQYMVDVYLDVDFSAAAAHDNLNETVNYEGVYRIVKDVMLEKSSLIEHVGQRIIEKIHEEIKNISSLKVRVSKMNPPLKGTVRRVFIEIEKDFKNK